MSWLRHAEGQYPHGPECFCDECLVVDEALGMLAPRRCPTCGSRECPGDGHSIDCRKPGTMTPADVPVETRDSLLDKFNRGEIDEETLRRRMRQISSSLRRDASDSSGRDAWDRRTRLHRAMQTMDPRDPAYQDMKAEYDALSAAAEEYARQPTLAYRTAGAGDDAWSRHLDRNDPEKRGRLEWAMQPCESCGHPLTEHLPKDWLMPGFFYSVLLGRLMDKAHRTKCGVWVPYGGEDHDLAALGNTPCECPGFIGRKAPVSPDEVPGGDPDQRRDELLDEMNQLPEGPERDAVRDRLRSFGWLRSVAVVRKLKDGWHVLSEEGKNLGGPYGSEGEAKRRLEQVEYFKHRKKADLVQPGQRVLLHGTTLSAARKILQQGVLPMRGKWTSEFHGEGEPLAFGADPQDENDDYQQWAFAVFRAMKFHVGQEIGKGEKEVTIDEVIDRGAIVEAVFDTLNRAEEDGEGVMREGPGTEDDPAWNDDFGKLPEAPSGPEVHDLYSRDPGQPVGLIAGRDLAEFIDANSAAWYEVYPDDADALRDLNERLAGERVDEELAEQQEFLRE